MSRPVLLGESLTLRYGSVEAVNDVTIEIGERELVGLIGPNGAGKTSLLDGLSGFAAMRGAVTLNGRRIDSEPAYRRCRSGVARTWQSHQLFDDLTVQENINVAADRAAWWSPLRDILLGSRVKSVSAADALERVGMQQFAQRLPGELSHGQRTLVGVARALAARPGVLLMDEPAAGLDTEETKRLGVTIRRIADEGTPILLVEHDMALVRAICDRIYVLNFGSLIASGSVTTVYKDPKVLAAYLGEPVETQSDQTHSDEPVTERASDATRETTP